MGRRWSGCVCIKGKVFAFATLFDLRVNVFELIIAEGYQIRLILNQIRLTAAYLPI